MAEVVKYKKPRKINVVSVTLALAAALLVYMAYQYVPLFIVKQEAYRVLEEHGSSFMSRKALYSEDPVARDGLRKKMFNQLRAVGVDDPDAETWIEVDGKEVRLGVVYTKWVEWPFGLIKRQEKVYEVEHLVVMD
jgi:hypothetical protein